MGKEGLTLPLKLGAGWVGADTGEREALVCDSGPNSRYEKGRAHSEQKRAQNSKKKGSGGSYCKSPRATN